MTYPSSHNHAMGCVILPSSPLSSQFGLLLPYQDENYFIDGMTMPLRMIFWQERKTIMVGIETITKPALTTQGISRHHWEAWYIQTASVHMSLSWQMIRAHCQPL